MIEDSRFTRTLVVHPHITGEKSHRSPKSRLEEAAGLAEALDLQVMDKVIVPLRQITPATYIGKGKVTEIEALAAQRNAKLVVMDCRLSPVQQRNLEKTWAAKVIDRTALIIEIFGARARTSEGKLQVELASLEYQKSRLVRSWTHLERQRGGFGFMAGPGETQIETDRRMISDRIAKIKRDLESARRTRGLHRKSRAKVPYPIIALVGYTNAGKSTLFNRLTKSKVVAEDKLFATLDPTMRIIKLPSNRKAILSDTVGFISDLPTELVASFRATLEEVIEADLILHVRDVSSEESDAENRDVLSVLENLGIKNKPMLEVLNKIDLIAHTQIGEIGSGKIPISALTGKGSGQLLQIIDKKLTGGKKIKIKIPTSEGKLIAWIYEHGEEVHAKPDSDFLQIEFKMNEKNLARLKTESVLE